MSDYSYDRRTAGYEDQAVGALDKLRAMTPSFREQLKTLNKALERSGLSKLQDAERLFERIIDGLQAAEYDLTQLDRS